MSDITAGSAFGVSAGIPRTGMWLFPELPALDLVETIRLAEALGLDELWIGDEGPAREPFAVLAAASQVTSKIGLGIGITNPYVRHPALAVTSALTVHELSGGRVMLGVGAGGQLSLGPFGLQAERPVGQVEKFVDTARAVRDGVPGPGYEPPDTAIDGSVTEQQMPIYIGGRGPRMNRLASAKADGSFVAGLPPFRYDEVIGWAREENDIAIALYPSVAFDEEAVEHHRPEMIWSLLDAPTTVCEQLGVDIEALPAAATALRAGDRRPAAAMITDDLLPHLILTGSPTEVGQRLAVLADQYRPSSIGLAVIQEDLQAAARDVAEAVQTMSAMLKAPSS